MTPTTASTDQSLKTKDYPIGALIFAEYNPRQLTKDQYKGLRDSIERFGLVDPIIVNKHKDRKNIVVGGHQRIRIAQDLGFKKIPCVEVELDADREKELNIRLNKNVGEWDWDALANHFDVGELLEWGFSEDELQFTEPDVQGLTDDDDIPEVEESITKQGDLWILGEHRLLCGDATKKEDVERLMDGNKAISCITDPPYSVNYENLKRRKDEPTRAERGDTYKDPPAEDVLKFINIIPSDVLVMSYPVNKHFHLLSDMTKEWELLYDCVWVKHHFAFIMSRRYQPKHEPILIFRKKKYKNSYFNVPSNQSTVFEFDKPARNVDHPTIKPIELYTTLVNYHSKHNQNIYEPFCGSGTTLIACEKTNRKCYGMEIDPHYCDVIVKRWEDYTGNKAERFEAASA
jgi:DNA modification methylase